MLLTASRTSGTSVAESRRPASISGARNGVGWPEDEALRVIEPRDSAPGVSMIADMERYEPSGGVFPSRKFY